MGRSERPLAPGPLHDFARDLRELRAGTGLTYRALGRVAGYAPSALSAAASGDVLPTADVLRAYVQACGGDTGSWEERRRRLAAALRRTSPGQLPGPVPGDAMPGAAAAAGHTDHPPAGGPSLPAPDGLSPLTAADPRQIGEVLLAARLGAGTMGQVYLGRGAAGEPAAVKIIRAELADYRGFRRRFRRELNALTTVTSPFVSPVTGGDAAAARPWLATAYTPAVTLADAITACGPLPPAAVCQLAAAIGGALAAIHGAGIVHRDLKPSNVLLTADGAHVIDFGIAHMAEGTVLTATGAHVGNAAYMAPEQASGATVSAAADVFALGSLLVYSLTGTPPFGEGRSEAVLYRIVHHPPDLAAVDALTSTDNNPNSDLGNLAEFIRACLSKDPAHRPVPASIAGRYPAVARPPVPGWLPAPAAGLISRNAAAALSSLAAMKRPRPGPRPRSRSGRGKGRLSTRQVRFGLAPLILAAAILISFTIVRNIHFPAPGTDRPPTPRAVTWTRATGNSVQSSPAVTGGTVYVASNDHKMYALDAVTGRVRWTRVIGSHADSSPAVAGGTVYIGSWDHRVYALDAATGHLRWTYATGSAIDSSPAVADGTVYIGSDDGRVYALDAVTGHIRWARFTGGDVESSPALAGGVVYAVSESGRVYALDAVTGLVRWTRAIGGEIVHSSPAIAGGAVYVGSDDGRVYALDAVTGLVRWTRATGRAVDSSPAIAGRIVYVGSENHKMYALDAATGRVRWARATGGFVDSSPVVAGGTVYVGSDDHEVYALDAVTGRVRWTHATGGFVESSPVVAGGTVYVGSDDHRVYALNAATGS
jgi:outer membrane protein assembly factor BamB/tRNA A-37 threonylcarbamoyl transferase component Bud32